MDSKDSHTRLDSSRGKPACEVALVTGGTSGIGMETALVLAERGAAVGVVGRNMDRAEAVVSKIVATGGRAIALRADVAKAEELASAVDVLVRSYGGLDTVVSSAGVVEGGTVEEMGEAAWLRQIDINLNGTYYLARYTVPHLLARGGGAFVAVSSDAGSQGASGFSAYCASKHGVHGLIKCMALDYGPKGIRANAVAPGFVETPMADQIFGNLTEAELEFYRRSVPLGRFATPRDVANVIAFLSSSNGAYANGMVYALDGGSTSGYFSAAPVDA